MQMKTGPAEQVIVNHGRFVRTIVVENKMDIQFGRNALINDLQKFLEFGSSMASIAFSDNFNGCSIQGSEQGRIDPRLFPESCRRRWLAQSV